MIAWLGIAFGLAAVVTGWNRPRSRPSLLLWVAALICLLASGGWPVSIALYGVVIGLRVGAIVYEEKPKNELRIGLTDDEAIRARAALDIEGATVTAFIAVPGEDK